MNKGRKWLAGLLGVVLFLTLIGVANSISFNRTFGTSANIKKTLADSKFYDQLVNSVLDKTQQETAQGQGDISVAYNNDTIKQAANQALTPQQVKDFVDSFIDANYAWLNGKTPKPTFVYDMTGSKQLFAQKVGANVTQYLNSLAVCTPQQQAQLQIPVDPLTVPCRPANLNPASEGARVAAEIQTGTFLSQPVITADSFNRDQYSSQPTYYQQVANAPKFFQLSKIAPWLLGVLSIILIAAILLVSAPRRRGLRKLGITFLVSGIFLLAIKVVSDWMAGYLDKKFLVNTLTGSAALSSSRQSIVSRLESQLTQTNMLFGIIFILIAAAILIYLYRTKDGRQPKPVRSTPQPVQESAAPVHQQPLQPHRLAQPVNPTEPVASAPRLPASPQSRDRLRQAGASQGPRQPRPPRLIQ